MCFSNVLIGCDDDKLGSEGKMGHTERRFAWDLYQHREEITLNMKSIANNAEKFGNTPEQALESTILHELAHVCGGSELDAKYIETTFYPKLKRFNGINYNQTGKGSTLGVICAESKKNYSGTNPDILQGKYIQWNKSTGVVTCSDSGELLPDREGVMSDQTVALGNCP